MTDRLLQDGNEAFAKAFSDLRIDPIELIVKTAKWVDPKVFQRLPVWYPESFRGAPLYDKTWQKRYSNKSKRTGVQTEKFEANERASKALTAALDFDGTNWTSCHIWGVDDPKFGLANVIVQDPRFYSCIGNMVLLPTPLKAFTDSVPEIKEMLRVCAYWLYDWTCDHDAINEQAERIRSGHVPNGYPAAWPGPERRILPPGLVKFSKNIEIAIQRREKKIHADLENAAALTNYPADKVREVMEYWKSRRSVSAA